ncbi:MAG: nucleotide exchange factor GrpE [Saprospiraceae bacterium]|nr:nucleotide exchange factor GrpE [Saprospiraceae bacterium]
MSENHKDSNIDEIRLSDAEDQTNDFMENSDEDFNIEQTSADSEENEAQQASAEEGDTNENTDPVKKSKAEIAELKDKYLRLYADFENYRKRTAKESLELRKVAGQEILSSLLPVMDDFDRAKQIAEKPDSKETFSEGIQLLYHKLQSFLKQKGLQKMESNGEVFDPELHEAITEIPAPSEDMVGKVIDTVEPGYFLNEKIIRYAKVVVGK